MEERMLGGTDSAKQGLARYESPISYNKSQKLQRMIVMYRSDFRYHVGYFGWHVAMIVKIESKIFPFNVKKYLLILSIKFSF